jgi:hypothetical protein
LNIRTAFVCLLATLLAACGGGSGYGGSDGGDQGTVTGDITLLFMGNSHTTANDLNGMVAGMVRAGRPDRTVGAAVAPGQMFLDERLHDAASMSLLSSQRWSFVILQAQKYSTSGQYTYSTTEAEEIIRRARSAGAVPIMFPEWPRRDVLETQRIFDLHVSIAQHEAACVAPIGQAWDLALARHPELTLHASDGNHSAPAGAFLAALVLYATITDRSPLDLPFLPGFPVDAATQALLRAIADETVRMVPPHQWCPGDSFP